MTDEAKKQPDADVPVKLSEGLEAAVWRARPRFEPCPECGELTTGSRCFECHVRRERRIRTRELLDETIPKGFQGCAFGAPELVARVHGNELLIRRAQDAIDANRVLLRGLGGMGKTSLVVAMMRAWSMARLEPATFAFAGELSTARMRDARFGHEAPEVQLALRAPLLVLDDVGQDEAIKGSAVMDVVFRRHAEALPTWVTTAMTSADIKTRYGDGFARRLLEGARVIECGGSK